MEKFMFLNWFDNLGVSLPVVGELIDYSRDLLLWYNGGRPQSGAAFISKLQLMEVWTVVWAILIILNPIVVVVELIM